MNQPFFIVGVPRSGTTLLSVLLDNHPDVYISPKAMGPKLCRLEELLMASYDKTRDCREGEALKRLMAALIHEDDGRWPELLQHGKLSEPEPRLSNIREYLLACFKDSAETHGKTRWGDKCPVQLDAMPKLRALLPEAKFIHVIRDGRAVAVSQRDRQYVDLYLAAQNWKRAVLKARFHGSYFGPEIYHEVRYESLLERPTAVCRAVCEFLGIPFHSTMLNLNRHKDVGRVNSYIGSSLEQSKINAWKIKVNPKQILKIEGMIGDLLLHLGYDLEGSASLQIFKYMTPLEYILRKQNDIFRMVFLSHRKVMKDRKIVEIRENYSRRLRGFVRNSAQLWLSRHFVAALLGRYLH